VSSEGRSVVHTMLCYVYVLCCEMWDGHGDDGMQNVGKVEVMSCVMVPLSSYSCTS